MIEVANEVLAEAAASCKKGDVEALRVLLGLMIDKVADYNSRQAYWDVTRDKVAHAFARHDLSMRWSFGEYDCSRNLPGWVLRQVVDAYRQIARLMVGQPAQLLDKQKRSGRDRVKITLGPAQSLNSIETSTIRCICVDPPYYDNVNYAECSNYFYIWLKRMVSPVFPEYFRSDLANEDDEAVMNVARFKAAGKKAKDLAIADYENKMMACFKEMHRILTDDGVLTVMFTHKKVEAWDTLGMALLRAGFRIDASWPVHTESEVSLHQAK
jgi:adenine-specific DNA methylase